jgi:hypothetical protein
MKLGPIVGIAAGLIFATPNYALAESTTSAMQHILSDQPYEATRTDFKSDKDFQLFRDLQFYTSKDQLENMEASEDKGIVTYGERQLRSELLQRVKKLSGDSHIMAESDFDYFTVMGALKGCNTQQYAGNVVTGIWEDNYCGEIRRLAKSTPKNPIGISQDDWDYLVLKSEVLGLSNSGGSGMVIGTEGRITVDPETGEAQMPHHRMLLPVLQRKLEEMEKRR